MARGPRESDDDLFKRLKRDGAQLDDEHMRYHPTWREISDFVCDRVSFDTDPTPGARRDQKRFDDTAVLACAQLAYSRQSMIMPRGPWFVLSDEDKGWRTNRDEAVWLEKCANVMHGVMAQPKRRFYSASTQHFYEDTGFGNGVTYCASDGPGGSWWRNVSITEYRHRRDERGRPYLVHRHFVMRASRVMAKYPLAAKDEKFKRLTANGQDPFVRVWHAIEPRPGGEAGGPVDDKPFATTVILPDHGLVVDKSGLDQARFVASAYMLRGNEEYGWGAAAPVLGDTKQLNLFAKHLGIASGLAIAPPIQMQAEGWLTKPSLAPFAVNLYKNMRPGEKGIEAISFGGSLPVGAEMVDRLVLKVRQGFSMDWLQLPEGVQMTRDEIAMRRETAFRVLAPQLMHTTEEFCGPIIDNLFDDLLRWRMLPEPPSSVLRRGIRIKVEYNSPAAMMQMAGDLEGTMQTIAAAAQLANFDNTVPLTLDAPTILRAIAARNLTPPSSLRSEEDVQQAMAQMREAQQRQQQAEEAAAATAAVRNLAHAASMAGKSGMLPGAGQQGAPQVPVAA